MATDIIARGMAAGVNKSVSKINLDLDNLNKNKVDKEENKGLSTNDFTDMYKSKLDNIDEEANKSSEAYAKCLDEYNKTKEIADGLSNKISTLTANAESATDRANQAASAAEGIVAEKIGIDDTTISTSTAYSSDKIESMLKVLATNRPKEWGVRFPMTSNPAGTRLGDAVNLVANVGTDTVKAYNDFDYLTPWKSRRVNGYWEGKNFVITAVEGEPNFAVDGSNGNVYAERHLFYYKYVFADDYYEIWISDTHLDGYSIPERFINLDGTVMDTYYYPCYAIGLDSSGNPVSISGLNTMINYSYTNYMNTLRSKLGTNYHTETTKDRQINELLFYVEFATRNSQDIMYGACNIPYSSTTDIASVASVGNKFICSNAVAGRYTVGQSICIGKTQNGSDIANQKRITAIETYDDENKAIVFEGSEVTIEAGYFISSRCWYSGATDSVLAPSGSPVSNTSGKYPMRYRYVENLWGNQWSIMADVLINDYQSYVCKDPTKFAISITDDYEKVSYVNADTNGYITKMGWDESHPYLRLPIAVGGSSNTYYCDYYYQATGLRVACVGGNVALGAAEGLVLWYCHYGVGGVNWDVAARLSYTA